MYNTPVKHSAAAAGDRQVRLGGSQQPVKAEHRFIAEVSTTEA